MFHCFIVSLLRFVSSFLRSFFGWSSEAAGARRGPHRGKGCRGNCFRTCCRASFRLTNELGKKGQITPDSLAKTVRPNVCTHCKGFLKPVFSYRLRQRPSTKGPPASSEFQLVSQGSRFREKNDPFLLACLSFFRTCRTWQSEMGTLFPTLLYHFRPAFTHIQGYFSLMRRFIFCVKS